MTTPKKIRMRIHVQEACELDSDERAHELLDIVIDHFGVRHIESMEEKIMSILEMKRDNKW